MNDNESIQSEKSQCAHQRITTKSPIEQITKLLCREVRQNKLTYEQLKRIFRNTRARCHIAPPKKSGKLIRLPSKEQLHTFLDAVDNPIHKLLFKTLLGTGLRVSELCNIEVSQINFSNNQIFIHQGKGAKDRIVIFSNNLKAQLQLYLIGKNLRYLFETERADKYSPRRVQQLFKHYSQKSNIFMHPHLCRHYVMTLWATEGLTEDQRAVLAGHAKGSDAQQIYTHLSLAGVADKAIEALDKNNL